MFNSDEREFLKRNRGYWNKHNTYRKNSKGRIILVEGQLMNAPNYLLRTAVSAKAIEKATGDKIVVIINTSKEMKVKARLLYGSFGIDKFINLKDIIIPKRIKIQAILKCIKIFFLNKPKDILQLSYAGINMGHLIYDDILHDDVNDNTKKRHYTIKRLDVYCLKHIYNFFIKAYVYQKLLTEKTVTAYVSTHTVYCEYGILPFLAISRHIPVAYTDDYCHSIIEDIGELYHHDRIRKKIKYIILSTSTKYLIKKAETDFEQRKIGNGNVDVRLAYSQNKKSYSKEDLRKHLGIDNQYPIVFIFAHVFRDSPHTSSELLYCDYYDWLENTLLYADKIKGINWIVKEHPSGEKIYKEKAVVNEILTKKKLSNIFLCPSEFNTNSIENTADAVVTCQGTIGMECSCLGIPVVICGKAFYSGFGFTIEPKNVKQYRKILQELNNVKKLNASQVKKAKTVYGAYLMYCGNSKGLLDDDILECIWGYNHEPNIQEAYGMINERIDNIDFEKSLLYQDTYNYFKNLD